VAAGEGLALAFDGAAVGVVADGPAGDGVAFAAGAEQATISAIAIAIWPRTPRS